MFVSDRVPSVLHKYGCQATMCDPIKRLIDVPSPHIVPDLGVAYHTYRSMRV